MFIYALFCFESGEMPADLPNKLHPRINTGAVSKYCFHLFHLVKLQLIALSIPYIDRYNNKKPLLPW